RGTEARCTLKERAERERDQQKLETPIGRHAADRGLQRLEHALRDRQPVKENNIEHDPADWKEFCYSSESSREQRDMCRHSEQKNCDWIGNNQRRDRSHVRLHLIRS